jgi:hypothetical protein
VICFSDIGKRGDCSYIASRFHCNY